MRSIITLKNKTAIVDVYRDGPAVVLFSKGAFEHETPHGMIRGVGQGMVRCDNLAVFEALRKKAKAVLAKRYATAPVVYTTLCLEFELDKDISGAEEIPEHLRSGARRLLPSGTEGT